MGYHLIHLFALVFYVFQRVISGISGILKGTDFMILEFKSGEVGLMEMHSPNWMISSQSCMGFFYAGHLIFFWVQNNSSVFEIKTVYFLIKSYSFSSIFFSQSLQQKQILLRFSVKNFRFIGIYKTPMTLLFFSVESMLNTGTMYNGKSVIKSKSFMINGFYDPSKSICTLYSVYAFPLTPYFRLKYFSFSGS